MFGLMEMLESAERSAGDANGRPLALVDLVLFERSGGDTTLELRAGYGETREDVRERTRWGRSSEGRGPYDSCDCSSIAFMPSLLCGGLNAGQIHQSSDISDGMASAYIEEQTTKMAYLPRLSYSPPAFHEPHSGMHNTVS